MQADSLYWIDPPDDIRKPNIVGREVLSLYRQDFSLTTKSICKLFHCERRWIQDQIRPFVRHLSVSQYFRKYIIEEFSLQDEELEAFLHSSYFYSKTSLIQFWKEQAQATQKTKIIDLADYVDPGATVDQLLKEQERHQFAKKSIAEKKLHFEFLHEILTEEGYQLFLKSSEKGTWKPVSLPMLPLEKNDIPLVTKAIICREQELNTDTGALNWLVNHGAIRIQLKGKTLWVVLPTMARCPIAIPY